MCGPQKTITPKLTFHHKSVNICRRKTCNTSMKTFRTFLSNRKYIFTKKYFWGFLDPKTLKFSLKIFFENILLQFFYEVVDSKNTFLLMYYMTFYDKYLLIYDEKYILGWQIFGAHTPQKIKFWIYFWWKSQTPKYASITVTD